jgi:hypothetical protein
MMPPILIYALLPDSTFASTANIRLQPQLHLPASTHQAIRAALGLILTS